MLFGFRELVMVEYQQPWNTYGELWSNYKNEGA